jgi:hypothetical protein
LLGETPPPVEKREGALPASELHAVRCRVFRLST